MQRIVGLDSQPKALASCLSLAPRTAHRVHLDRPGVVGLLTWTSAARAPGARAVRLSRTTALRRRGLSPPARRDAAI